MDSPKKKKKGESIDVYVCVFTIDKVFDAS